MPRKAIDYAKTLIYKLVCNDVDVKDLYVGHTTSFVDRKKCHKNRCNDSNGKKYNYKVYKMIRENGGWENWSMVLIEPYPCENKLVAEKKEREWYEELKASLNSQVPSRTIKEWREDNREKINEKRRERYEASRIKINEMRREKYKKLKIQNQSESILPT